ncbi:NAD(P)H-binding protein [Thalassotalea sp. 1_MG-2023]|uniref:NAD(P)H-binding protein n=1 Tax=Thalassotalea sp. 1_MG-2023 TaxID=3062680 RepID=UPI0026E1476C|nr:NAD(P)H-binding protein [Thalassotalea sp. 1_MG-2023]MDO6426785.1 NAD(P)H-binding protein [Thalassotalea sp. 1_MG-2023]
MKTAIVIGATGLIGQHLLTQLLADSTYSKIIAFTRKPIKSKSKKLVNHVIDFNQLGNYQNDFIGDVLFSCLGTTKKQAGSIEKQRMVDVDYQYQAAKMAAENGVAHYVLVSSSGANKNANSAYFKMKGELEDKVKPLSFQRMSILQPSLLLGERDHFRLGEVLSSYLLPIICKLPFLKRYRPIEGAQVAKKMLNVSKEQKEPFEIFTLDELFK